MTKEEKIRFVIETFEGVLPSYLNDSLGPINMIDHQWLNRYVSSTGFENSLNLDSNLDDAYQAAINISKLLY